MKTRSLFIATLLLILLDLILYQNFKKDEVSEAETQLENATATLEIIADERIELLSVVQHFTSWANNTNTKPDLEYKNEIDAWFASFAKHEAVRLCQQMMDKGFTSEMPVAFISCHSYLPELKQIYPYSSRILNRGGSQHQLENFASALKDFAEVSNFQAFFNSHQSFYQ